jgi:hypothetical protein
VKVRDVPQDPGACFAGHEKLNYAVGDDGRYTGVPTIGWETEIAATEVGLRATVAAITAAWESARAGKTSPLAYHMAAAQMDVGQLATDTGLWSWRVRRHLRPAVFAGLSPALLDRYADALGIAADTLRTVPPAPDTP